MDLDDDTIERIAQRVAQLLSDRAPKREATAGPVRLVDAAKLAHLIDVRREWVYRHARQLGALRLGGPGGVLRFDLDVVLERDRRTPESSASERPEMPGRSGLGAGCRTTYSRTRNTKSGRAALQRPRPDTARKDHAMQDHRSAKGGRR